MLKIKKVEGVLLFLTLLFLPTQLGRHFWPKFSYIYSLKIDYLSPTLYFWDILAVGLLGVWVLQKPKINKLALNLLLFFLFTQALSLIGASNPGAGLVRLEQYALAGFFGVFLASLDYVSLTQKIFLPLILGILAEFLIAILQFIKGSALGLWILGERAFTISTPGIAKFDFYGYQFLRPYATLPHPNVLAGYLLVVIILLSFWGAKRLRNPDSGRARMTIFWIAACLVGLTIFLTMSRVAILAGFVMLAIFLRRKSFFFIIFLIITMIIISPVLFTRFSSLLNFDNLTFVRREELMKSSWDMFLKSPLYGVGLNNFIPVAAGDLLTGPSRFLQPVHNIFLLVLSETGIIGLAGFLLLVGYPIRKIFNPSTTSTSLSTGSPGTSFQFSIFNLMPWLIILFLGMFDHYFLTLPQGYRLLFLVWGLSFSILK